MSAKFDFTGKTVLVTGGASGIGRASALAFGQAGASVAVADLSPEAGEAVASAIRADGGSAAFFPIDVADEEAVIPVEARPE